MTRPFFVALALVVATISVVALSGAGAATTAGVPAPNNTTTATTTVADETDVGPPTTTPDPDSLGLSKGTATPTPEPETVIYQFGPAVELTDYEFSDGVVTVTFRSKIDDAVVTLTEAPKQNEQKVQKLNIRSGITLDRGMNRIRFDLRDDDSQVLVGVGYNDDAYGVSLQSGTSGGGLFDGSASWDLVYLAGLVAFVGSVVGVREWRIRNSDDDEPRVEQV